MKPFLKWAGGKSALVGEIAAAFGPDKCSGVYHEPFLGSGAVFFGLKAKGLISDASLSDSNFRLASLFQSVRMMPHQVSNGLSLMPSGPGWANSYYEIREKYNQDSKLAPSFEQSVRFIWLNRACFNGLYRENKSGDFNVPKGSYKQLSLPPRAAIACAAAALRDTLINSNSAIDAYTFDECGGDWMYLDPPYAPLNSTSFTSYTGARFGVDEHRALAARALEAVQRGVKVVVSNHDTPFVRELYSEDYWELRPMNVRRSIGAGRSAAQAPELLIVGRSR
ncbi:MAG: Dam family site-specific DNA-(adenine-N6)-methyltransferase [Hyphomicrobium sp.]|nr:Dam family site-specific DNA-(adenine-N6)-methyltransferase [Hyphomicrobium sp.]